MSIFNRIPIEGPAEENARAMKGGDHWIVTQGKTVHSLGPVENGNTFCFVIDPTALCKVQVKVAGHAKPGRPNCPGCVAASPWMVIEQPLRQPNGPWFLILAGTEDATRARYAKVTARKRLRGPVKLLRPDGGVEAEFPGA